MRGIAASLLSIAVVVPVTADPARVVGTDVRFTVTKLGFADVIGRFHDFNADITYDPAHPERSVVRWRVRVASVDTGERDRDRSIQNQDYFAAAQYPELTFTSRDVRSTGTAHLSVTGDLSIRGVTRSVTVPVVVTEQNGRRTFVTDFELDRYDFNVRGGPMVSRLIGRTVRVHLAAMEGAGQ
jgi:polyisoprenoid-binding protein YceI